LAGAAHAAEPVINNNTTTNKKVAAYNQGYASTVVTDVCLDDGKLRPTSQLPQYTV
jgi:hypothetical protein